MPIFHNVSIDIDWREVGEKGSAVSGDVCITKKGKDRTVMVVCDGCGSGVKANIYASVVASMSTNYALAGEHPLRAAKAIVETFSRGVQKLDYNQATFTIISIRDSGTVRIVEFENPLSVIVRNGIVGEIDRSIHRITLDNGREINIVISQLEATFEDRIVVFTDGVTQSGFGTKRMSQGWGREGAVELIKNIMAQNPTISSTDLCQSIVDESEKNDLFVAKNDIGCASIYFRTPRKILICTGPPFHEKEDAYLAQRVKDYKGEVIISGGTTAGIIARELGREINVVLKRDPAGLPPASRMEGATMVTEGVLTLAKGRGLLHALKSSEVKAKGIAGKYAQHLLDHDVIEFLVGNRINSVHHDPTLPAELELRRSVVKEIAHILETKFMKRVIIDYL